MPTSLRTLPSPPSHLPPPKKKKKKKKKIFDPSAIFDDLFFSTMVRCLPLGFSKKKRKKRSVNARELDRESTLRVPRMPVAPANRVVRSSLVSQTRYNSLCMYIYSSISAYHAVATREGSTWGIVPVTTREGRWCWFSRDRGMMSRDTIMLLLYVCVCIRETIVWLYLFYNNDW